MMRSHSGKKRNYWDYYVGERGEPNHPPAERKKRVNLLTHAEFPAKNLKPAFTQDCKIAVRPPVLLRTIRLKIRRSVSLDKQVRDVDTMVSCLIEAQTKLNILC